MAAKRRLDALLVERGLVETRSRAQALVMAGRVTVDGAPATKAGTPTAADAAVELIAPPRYVSRGGEKLETALAAFGVDVAGERCLDVGA
jgi:23S rRNA (cytidine1920-2'-O)/16S rRNA (cytidine1409-2'-O)-methyltransferase